MIEKLGFVGDGLADRVFYDKINELVDAVNAIEKRTEQKVGGPLLFISDQCKNACEQLKKHSFDTRAIWDKKDAAIIQLKEKVSGLELKLAVEIDVSGTAVRQNKLLHEENARLKKEIELLKKENEVLHETHRLMSLKWKT